MNIFLEGETIKALRRDEVLQPNDLVRLTEEIGVEPGFDLSGKPEGYLPLAWHKASDELSEWVGFEIQENPFFKLYEFIRVID
jgi:hypothetical protein